MEQGNYTLNMLKMSTKRLAEELEELKVREARSYKAHAAVTELLAEKQIQLRSVLQSIELLEEVL